jgi:hypothetical protein
VSAPTHPGRSLRGLLSTLTCPLLAGLLVAACAHGTPEVFQDAPSEAPDLPADEEALPPPVGFENPDGATVDAAKILTPDAACAAAVEEGTIERPPVDIVWVVDNSASMEPAVRAVTSGLNAFARSIAASDLDYRIIMLSNRGKRPIQRSGSTRYPVCIPAPLAGDSDCGDGERFFHAQVDILSTQPLEQFLGTMDQTPGYRDGEKQGSEPWSQHLRPNATKSIVVVTDDDSRLTADEFEHFPGGRNPNNPNNELPEGLLGPSRNSAFDGYKFHAIYGWGSETNANQRCMYPDRTYPPKPGLEYTDLVSKTGGVRAKVCDRAASWKPFFDAVATAVEKGSQLSCEVTIPQPKEGTVDPNRVNVRIDSGGNGARLVRVPNAAACDEAFGWHYDDEASPKKVVLCPSACAIAKQQSGSEKKRIEVLFGCASVLK